MAVQFTSIAYVCVDDASETVDEVYLVPADPETECETCEAANVPGYYGGGSVAIFTCVLCTFEFLDGPDARLVSAKGRVTRS